MIDTSKIKSGDTGTIKVRFRELGKDGTFWWTDYGLPGPLEYMAVPHEVIASHTPEPWVPEKGDVVMIWDSSAPEWKVLAIDGEAVWIGYGKDHMTTTAKYLRLIRKGAA